MLNAHETINLRRWCFSSDGSFLCTCYNSGISVYSFRQNQDHYAYSMHVNKLRCWLGHYTTVVEKSLVQIPS